MFQLRALGAHDQETEGPNTSPMGEEGTGRGGGTRPGSGSGPGGGTIFPTRGGGRYQPPPGPFTPQPSQQPPIYQPPISTMPQPLPLPPTTGYPPPFEQPSTPGTTIVVGPGQAAPGYQQALQQIPRWVIGLVAFLGIGGLILLLLRRR